MAHCGLVGHSLRRQYIVIGAPLQKAIELGIMCVEKVRICFSLLFKIRSVFLTYFIHLLTYLFFGTHINEQFCSTGDL